MKIVEWYCENCGTTVIPGAEVEWDETSKCPGCEWTTMVLKEPKSPSPSRKSKSLKTAKG
jgi:DNA-directed RNA polymerase subunit RPC12/RpoP